MKYIKTFENIKKPNLKKYILITYDPKSSIQELLIIENLFIEYVESSIFTGNIVKYKELYKYNKKMKKILKMNHISESRYKNLKSKIIFQSDNLNDCIDKMNMIFDIQKYNL